MDHRPQPSLLRVAAWIGRQQEHLGDRIHAAGDALARDTGWTVTRSTGRLGFGSRTYRDPRFDQLRAQAQHEPGAGWGSPAEGWQAPCAATAAAILTFRSAQEGDPMGSLASWPPGTTRGGTS
jgi:hypothetical protein